MFALTTFIPQIWSAQLLISLKKSLVYGQEGVVNRNYEGEISGYGDTVKINSIGTITVGDYTRDTDIQDPETLTGAQTTLTINQSKYFNFQVDDIDKAQTNPKIMNQAMVESAYALRNVADSFIASTMVAGVKAENQIGTDESPVVPTANNAIDYLVDLGVKLDENNVPEEGRWVILPPWYHALIEKSPKYQYTESGQGVITNGIVGRIAGFDVLKSNNVPNQEGAKYKILAGHAIATTYAEQVNDVEAYRPEKRFADAIKGLHLYGAKVVRPEALALLTASKA
jgi:N4-gp56 family major capsid protein